MIKKATILTVILGAIFLVGCTKKQTPVKPAGPDYGKTRDAAEKSWGEM
ncbi:MAG: hypothetical protein OIF32_04020 [Campylobacterales bacterium]|nr:hypothetical protein [Campylobacterales bacterium]